MTQRTLLTLASILVGLAVLSVPLATHAQNPSSPSPEKVPTWVKTFGKQLRAQLESDDPLIKRQALHHITYFASFYEEKIDFSDAVPALVDLYKNDDDANVRLYALVALHTIGDRKGMQQVRDALHEQRWPPRLQFVTLSALVDFYGADTFEMDREAATMAKNLIRLYTPEPRIDVGPMEVLPLTPSQEEENTEGQ